MRERQALARVAVVSVSVALGCAGGTGEQPWERDNPLRPLPDPPLGIQSTFDRLPDPPTPETVRLGRWLYYDTRLSADGTIACANCHLPEHAFSEPRPVSVGIGGQQGQRKAPSFVNMAWTIYPHFFWDGRAASLEEQALGPPVNPIEMGHASLDAMVAGIAAVEGYAPYFRQAFGDPEVTAQRIARAIADYERTRMSGNSAWDRWRAGDETAVSEQVKLGHELFFGKAECNQCHLGESFTDSSFHNLGIGWNAATREFADVGRAGVTGEDEDSGAFKTPGLRECTKHGPYMHDGSIADLRLVVEHYNKGGNPNPHLSPKIRPLGLSDAEVDAIVAFLASLDGEGYQDTAPTVFPS